MSRKQEVLLGSLSMYCAFIPNASVDLNFSVDQLNIKGSNIKGVGNFVVTKRTLVAPWWADTLLIPSMKQGLVKGAILCFRNLYFYFRHGESTSTASQKSKDLNKVPLLLQDLALPTVSK